MSLVFTGALNKAGEISPAIDTGGDRGLSHHAAHAEDVERLETLDVSGRTPALESRREPEDQTEGVGSAVPSRAARPTRTLTAEPPRMSRRQPTRNIPRQTVPSASTTALPSAGSELLGGREESTGRRVAPAAPASRKLPCRAARDFRY